MVNSGGKRKPYGSQKIPIPPALREADLLTPRHDEILIWLAENAASLFSEFRPSWRDDSKRRMIENCAEEVRRACEKLDAALSSKTFAAREGVEPVALTPADIRYAREHLARLREFPGLSPDVSAPPASVIERQIQLPVHKIKRPRAGRYLSDEEGPVIGFVDFYIKLKLWSLDYTTPFNDIFEKGKRIEEAPRWYASNYNYAVEEDSITEYHFYCDVRADIPSLGELMRQIRFMEEELPHQGKNSMYVIVSPTDTYEELLNEEGIFFVWYDED